MRGFFNVLGADTAVPTGTVAFYAGETVPAGWLVMDGRLLSQSAYPALYEALGDRYGAAPSGMFYLPDARGLFLRGQDTPRYVPTQDAAPEEGKAYYIKEGEIFVEVSEPSLDAMNTYYEETDGRDPARVLGSVQEATMATSYPSVGQHLIHFKHYDAGDGETFTEARLAYSTSGSNMPTYRYDVAMRPVNIAFWAIIKT